MNDPDLPGILILRHGLPPPSMGQGCLTAFKPFSSSSHCVAPPPSSAMVVPPAATANPSCRRTHVADIQDDCLALIFLSLDRANSKRCSLVCHTLACRRRLELPCLSQSPSTPTPPSSTLPRPSSPSSIDASPMLAARPASSSPAPASGTDRREIRRAVAEKPVVVVGRRGCCMSYVVTRLLHGHGVDLAVCEVGEDVTEAALVEELGGSCGGGGGAAVFPALFIGGRLVGSLDWLIAAHISGDLLPILKDAGALWL